MEDKTKKIALVITGIVVLVIVVLLGSGFLGKARGSADSNLGNIEVVEDPNNKDDEPKEDEEIVTEDSKIDSYTDELGIDYVRRELPSFGISMLLPEDWEISEAGETIYLYAGDSDKAKKMQISLTRKQTPVNTMERITDNFDEFINRDFKYTNQAEFGFREFSFPKLEKVENPEMKVAVDYSIPSRRVQSLKPTSSTYTEENYLYGYKSSADVELSGIGNPVAKASPRMNFYFFSDEQASYLMTVSTPKKWVERADIVGDTILKSVRELDSDSLSYIKIPEFDSELKVGSMKFKVPSQATLKKSNSSGVHYRMSSDPGSPFYNMNVTIMKAKYSGKNTNLLNLKSNPAAAKVMLSGHLKSMINAFTDIPDLIHTPYEEQHFIYGNGKNAVKGRYNIKFTKNGSMRRERYSLNEHKLDGAYVIFEDGAEHYIVSVTSNTYNYELSKNLLNQIISTIEFG